MRKLLIIIITTFTLVTSVNASSDGELILKKNDPSEVRDCFETLNRAHLHLNQGLDGIFLNQSQVYTENCHHQY